MRALAPAMVLIAACGELPDSAPSQPVWSNDVEGLFSRCAECHASSESFFALMSTCSEDGERWVRPADPASPILTVLDRADHQALLDPAARERISAWVGGESPFTSATAHAPGFSTKHGRSAFDVRPCLTCHAAPPEKGGTIACTTCHAKPFGLEKCDNCHDHQPRSCDSKAQRTSSALHLLHANGGEDGTFPPADCASCHRVPRTIVDRGHFDGGPQIVVPYDATTKTCTAPVCHATKPQTWAEPSGDRCGRCHGAPPPDHASSACNDCHRGATHLDRTLDVGTGCESCHPRGQLGGGHRAHLLSSRFRNPIDCTSCHLVPATRDAPGHIDSPPPAEVTLPGWDTGNARCADVGCHGAKLDGGAIQTEPWSASAEPLACGSCHALPPVLVRGGASTHLPTGSADCGVCHRTPEGAPISIGIEAITPAGRAVHGNGRVELAEGL